MTGFPAGIWNRLDSERPENTSSRLAKPLRTRLFGLLAGLPPIAAPQRALARYSQNNAILL